MKTHISILFLVLSFLVFTGCNRDEQTPSNKINNIYRSAKTNYNILCKDKIPPLVKDLITGEPEIFCDYVFTDCNG